jgi:hypothetical protein
MKTNLLIVLAGVVYAFYAVNILVAESTYIATVINSL